jgi:hypothetical protein
MLRVVAMVSPLTLRIMPPNDRARIGRPTTSASYESTLWKGAVDENDGHLRATTSRTVLVADRQRIYRAMPGTMPESSEAIRLTRPPCDRLSGSVIFWSNYFGTGHATSAAIGPYRAAPVGVCRGRTVLWVRPVGRVGAEPQ